MDAPEQNVTKLLSRLGKGDPGAESELVDMVFPYLRRLAAHYMRAERPDHTLEPTALVNEAYLRLVRAEDVKWESRAHFFGLAARLMRQVLVDHARGHNADKRFGIKASLDEVFVYSQEKSSVVLALDEALTHLAEQDPRMSQVVELRFFGGLTFEEIATVLQVSEKTAKRDWQLARVWLHREIRKK
jgi:RNA polymerase sigma-70 factor (ECF subfamily)